MYFFDDLCYLQFLTIFLQFRNNYENELVLHKSISYSCIETIVGISIKVETLYAINYRVLHYLIFPQHTRSILKTS